MKKYLKISVKISAGVLVSSALIYLMLRKTDFSELMSIIAKSSVLLIATGASIHLASYFIIGIRLRILLGKGAGVFKISVAVMTGYLFNIIFFRLGDVLKCFFLKDSYEIPHTAAGVVTEKLMDSITVVCCAVIPVFFFNSIPAFLKKLILIPLILLLITIAVIILSAKSIKVENVIVKIINKLPFKEKLLNFYNGFNFKIKEVLKNPFNVFISFLITLFLWFVYLLFYSFTVWGVGLKLDLWQMIFVLGVTTLGMNVPASVGFVGTMHYAFYISAFAVGGDKNTAMAAGFILHLSKIFGHIVMGGIGMIFQKMPSIDAVKKTLKKIKLKKSKHRE